MAIGTFRKHAAIMIPAGKGREKGKSRELRGASGQDFEQEKESTHNRSTLGEGLAFPVPPDLF